MPRFTSLGIINSNYARSLTNLDLFVLINEGENTPPHLLSIFDNMNLRILIEEQQRRIRSRDNRLGNITFSQRLQQIGLMPALVPSLQQRRNRFQQSMELLSNNIDMGLRFNNSSDCYVCFQPLSKEWVAFPNCGHMIHQSCANQLLINNNNKCGICRSDLAYPDDL